jgi:hypothetical protein
MEYLLLLAVVPGRFAVAVRLGRDAARRLLAAGGWWRRVTLGLWCLGWAGMAVATVRGVSGADLIEDPVGGWAAAVADYAAILVFVLASGTALRVLFRYSYHDEPRDAWLVWLLLGAVVASPFIPVIVA